MGKHRGEALEIAIKEGPYSIKTLAKKLRISRNTLYNKFKKHDLSYEFILQVGDIIHYDFKEDFPELKTTVPIDEAKHAKELQRFKKDYTRLLERYHKLFSVLFKITHEHGLDTLKKAIDQVTERNR